VNVPSPRKRGSPTRVSNSERGLETPRATIDDKHRRKGAMNIPQIEGSLGRTYPIRERSEILAPKSILTEIGKVSSTPGAPVEVTAVSVSACDLPHEPLPNTNVPAHENVASHQSPTLAITGESNRIANTALRVGTSEQPSRKRSLMGRV